MRWTTSKALSRISSHLPLSYVDQIVTAIQELYAQNVVAQDTPLEDLSLVSSHAWHGATLCLASFLRQTLLDPSQVQSSLPWILRALTFSQRKGAQKIGSSIRDSACYFVWCIARAYSKQDNLLSQDHIEAVCKQLILVACCDEEVSVRRAASAAYQECVGRIVSLPAVAATGRIDIALSISLPSLLYLTALTYSCLWTPSRSDRGGKLFSKRLPTLQSELQASIVPTKDSCAEALCCRAKVLDVSPGSRRALAQQNSRQSRHYNQAALGSFTLRNRQRPARRDGSFGLHRAGYPDKLKRFASCTCCPPLPAVCRNERKIPRALAY